MPYFIRLQYLLRLNSLPCKHMPISPDIRWQQRFANYQKALGRLSAAVSLSQERPLSDLEKQGLIQAFEFTHELAWNVIKDIFVGQGAQNIMGSRDATREAFNRGLIEDGNGWMEMILSRNQTSHTYNEEVANEIADRILQRYHPLFVILGKRIEQIINTP